MYDVIVVGARVAGASTALLLARHGLKVLAVDRAAFPSDTLSTHQVQVPGVARLLRWGILDGVLASGTPAAAAVRFDPGPVVLRGRFPEFELAEELLETAAGPHDDGIGRLRRSAQVGEAHVRLERDGDVSAFDGVLTRDVAFVMFDRIERRGATHYAAALASGFEDGVRSRLGQVIPGHEITIVEVWLDSPPEQPLHCPQALTQIHFHRGGPTSRIVSHYAPRPAGSS